MTDAPNKGWLFILPWVIENVGGVNRVVLELCAQCLKTGDFRPYIAIPETHCYAEMSEEIRLYKQIKFIPYILSLRNNDIIGKIKNALYYLVHLPYQIMQIVRLIKKNNIKVINFHYVGGLSPLSFAIVKLSPIFRFSLLLSFHGSDVQALEKCTRMEKIIFNFILSKTDYAVGCSRGLSDQIKKLFPAYDDKVKFIYNGISDLFFTDAPSIHLGNKLPEQLQGKRFILWVGAFIYIKGHDLLIKAFSQIREKNPDLLLVIIGKSATESKNCSQLIESLNLKQSVYIYERVSPEHLKVFYDHAHIFVSPSRYESFGLALAEAGARGVPLVATRTKGAKEIIENNVSGILVKKENVHALANGISSLLDSPESYRILSKNIRNKICSHFKWEYAWKKYRHLVVEDKVVELSKLHS